MSKAVMISIKPKWCEKIANGEKTVEVRKTKPTLQPPFKCYIYCTKPIGKVIGEFVCDKIEKFTVGSLQCDDMEKSACLSYTEMIDYIYKPEELDGKTVKFAHGWHISNLKIYDEPKELSEFYKICGSQDCCDCQFWISNGEYTACKVRPGRRLKHPPMSWCYVEENEE